MKMVRQAVNWEATFWQIGRPEAGIGENLQASVWIATFRALEMWVRFKTIMLEEVAGETGN